MNTLSTFSSNHSSRTVVKWNLFYILAVIAVCLMVNLSVRLDYYFLKGIPELSITETLQGLALIFINILFYKAIKISSIGSGSLLVFGFFTALLIRECDFWFDKISHGFWLYPALISTLSVLYLFSRKRKQGLREFVNLLKLPAMSKVIVGVVVLVIFSRIFGTGSFWREVVSQDAFVVKTIIQEGLELLCYCFISIGAWETYQQAKMANTPNCNNR
ncbi:hypothetical protein [Pseudoalteromonas sp. G4]|uniref:hypothetical protein n=1 Tax=Pseudoalteromonas sp. G4 TaxID=2992761 RepID=UPI00237E062C|nr:hypothetical protein [Pseudoalteromonas sp. G4]MDE3270574.1 hypothetical protein [Pseudoalteromonas sp. G4]